MSPLPALPRTGLLAAPAPCSPPQPRVPHSPARPRRPPAHGAAAAARRSRSLRERTEPRRGAATPAPSRRPIAAPAGRAERRPLPRRHASTGSEPLPGNARSPSARSPQPRRSLPGRASGRGIRSPRGMLPPRGPAPRAGSRGIPGTRHLGTLLSPFPQGRASPGAKVKVMLSHVFHLHPLKTVSPPLRCHPAPGRARCRLRSRGRADVQSLADALGRTRGLFIRRRRN